MAASRVDLHIHTTVSDGTWTPEEAAREAIACDMIAIAITDHDDVAGVAPAAAVAEPAGIEVVPAVEIDTDYADSDVHVLGYYLDIENPDLLRLLARIREARIERARKIIDRLARLGCRIEEGRVLEIAGSGSVGRPHIAAAMVEAGCVTSVTQAFETLIGRGAPAFVQRYRLLPAEAIQHVRNAGGIAVLAHPVKLRDDHIIEELIADGLQGIEAYHCDHSRPVAEHYRRLADQRGLLVTGGTDSHGMKADRPVPMGSVRTPEACLHQLKEAWLASASPGGRSP